MASQSKIEWTETTWNPVVGCTWKSPGCDNCYAARMSRRLEAMGKADYVGLTSRKHFNGTVRTLDHKLVEPLGWRKPRRVFVNSMSDLFHESVPFDFIDEVLAVMALCPQHTFQVLTKRPERMADYLQSAPFSDHVADRIYHQVSRWLDHEDGDPLGDGVRWDKAHNLATWRGEGGWTLPLTNVWLGTSVEDQASADERIPHLLRCPAAVRFLSCEPLLGPVDLHLMRPAEHLKGPCGGGSHLERRRFLHWIIVGGESGPGARPMHPDWARSLRDQCEAVGVALFFKQWGAWEPFERDGIDLVGQSGQRFDRHVLPSDIAQHKPGHWYWPWGGDDVVFKRVGKKAAGRLLDKREWNDLPGAAGTRAAPGAEGGGP